MRRDTFLADRIEFDERLLTDFYNARGYIDFKVNDVNAELTEENNAYFVTFNVREGQMFRFGDVTLISERSDIDVEDFQIAFCGNRRRLFPNVDGEKPIRLRRAQHSWVWISYASHPRYAQ